MKTEIFTESEDRAAELLKNGGLVAVPTETVYGLAGNGLNAEAVERIYEVKGRPAVKPLSLMVHSSTEIEKYCFDVPQDAYILADKFWPGPLTIVLNAKNNIPSIVLAGGNTVGLRCPDHSLTLQLLEKAGVPFAAPSANPSSEPSPKNAAEVLSYFNGKIEAVVDGGACRLGNESTLLLMNSVPYRVLRQGALAKEEIADALLSNAVIIGLYGMSGVGKSTALSVIEELGGTVFDCDKIYHRLLENDVELKNELGVSFPAAVKDNCIDRKTLAGIVFGDASLLELLNKITEKYVVKEVKRLLQDGAMHGQKLYGIDAVHLMDSGLDLLCTDIIKVTADYDLLLNRIQLRDGIGRDAAEKRLQAQLLETRSDHPDHILENNGNEETFCASCKDLILTIIGNHKK